MQKISKFRMKMSEMKISLGEYTSMPFTLLDVLSVTANEMPSPACTATTGPTMRAQLNTSGVA